MGILSGLVVLLVPGLLGLLAIAIPVGIHLFSRSRGRKVLIGNIELVKHARTQRVSEIRLTQWLLLLIRVLILLIAALILARLAAPGLEDLDHPVTYVTPQWLSAASDEEVAKLNDPGIGAGELRLLSPGFSLLTQAGIESLDPDYDAWPLLAERLSLVRHRSEVSVFSTDTSGEFGMHRPLLPVDIHWRGLGQPLTATPPPLSVLIVHDQGRGDAARALEETLQMLRRHRLPGLQWKLVTPAQLGNRGDGPDMESENWIAWLSASAVPGSVPANGARMFMPGVEELQHLASRPDFPMVILKEILGEKGWEQAWNQAQLGTKHWLPDRITLKPGTAIMAPNRILQPALAMLLVLLWGLERWLAEKRRSTHE